MPYPDALDLVDHLIRAGIVPDSETATGYHADLIDSAVLAWERDTGWMPFLNEQTSEGNEIVTRDYKIEGVLSFFLPAGGILIDEVRLNDEVLEEDLDYLVVPKYTTPKRFLQFTSKRSGKLSIDLIEGYTDILPADVKLALLSYATANYLKNKSGDAGEVSEVRQGEVTIKYGTEAGQSTFDRLMNEYKNTVERYRRYGFG